MSDAAHKPWKPSPELLAAFADGELDGRDDAAAVRTELEAWLDKNPQARAELEANRQLDAMFQQTRPNSPSSETWRAMLQRIEDCPAPAPVSQRPKTRWILGGAAAAACLVWMILLGSSYWRSPGEVFAVASDADIEIIHIDGDAIDLLVVGRLPLTGVLELANPGEVTITSVSPARRDNMIPTVHIEGPRRPMIWAKLESESE